MKSLLVFTEVYNPGGGNRYMVDLINAVSQNYEQLVIASNRGGIYSEDIDRLNGSFSTRPVLFVTRSLIGNYFRAWPSAIRNAIAVPLVLLEPLFFLANVVLFHALIRRLKPSRVLSCNGGYPAATACLSMVIAARWSRVPVALSVVSMPMARGTFLRLYEKFVDRWVWRSVDLVIVNARVIADSLCKLREMPRGKQVVIHNGLEDKAPAVARDNRKDHFVVGCIARMDVSKGALLLFDAFAHLVKRHPELRLVLAGRGDASAELARRTEALGLQNQIQLLGHYDGDVGALLGTFDLYVFPSLWEGFPYSVIEAMRAGCTIIATRVGGIPEAIAEGKEGLLIEPGSKEAIILAMERLLANPALRRSLGRNARLRYESELSLEKMYLRVREVFAVHQFC